MTHYDYSKDFTSLRKEARERIVEALQDYEGYYCDFHNQVFNEDYYVCGVVRDFLSDHGYFTHVYGSLSDIIKTMTGDAATPFNTLAEMIQDMPDIIDHGEETCIFEVFGPTCDYWVLGWDYEENEKLWTKILQKYFPDYVAVETED